MSGRSSLGKQFAITEGPSFKPRPGNVQGSLFTTRPVGERPIPPSRQPRKFFHATDAPLKPGDTIRPAAQVPGARSVSQAPNRAFAAADRRLTDLYERSRRGQTYEVEPVGRVQEFRATHLPPASGTVRGMTQYTAPGYRVVGPAGPSRAPVPRPTSPRVPRMAQLAEARRNLQANPRSSDARAYARGVLRPLEDTLI